MVYTKFHFRITTPLSVDSVFVALYCILAVFSVRSLDNVLRGFIRAVVSDAYTCLEGRSVLGW